MGAALRTLGALVLPFAVIATSVATPRIARADATKDACFDAYEQAQKLRKKGQLRAAQKQLVRCAKSECPGFVANDCSQWSRDVEVSMPTVIFVAKDQRGQDLVDVAVAVDGETLQSRIEGRALAIDPGAHTVRYITRDKTVDVSVVLAEGEKARRIEATFAILENAQSTGSEGPAKPGEKPHGRSIPTASYVLAGVGAVAAVSFVGFAVGGKGNESCAPSCNNDQVSALRRDYVIADISWITGLLALGGAVALWALQPNEAAPPTSGATSRAPFTFTF